MISNHASGYGNNGFVSGPVYINRKFGHALGFNGENNSVRVPDSITLNPTSITIEAWIFINSSKTSWHSILTKMDKLQDSGYELCIIQQNYPRFGLISKGIKKVTDGNYIPLNKWTHIAATYDRRAIILYNNCEFDSYDEKTGFLGTASKEDLYIGSWRDVDYFSGAIDEVHIYNRSLSDIEIKENYNSAINPINRTLTIPDNSPGINTEANSNYDRKITWIIEYSFSHRIVNEYSNSEEIRLKRTVFYYFYIREDEIYVIFQDLEGACPQNSCWILNGGIISHLGCQHRNYYRKRKRRCLG